MRFLTPPLRFEISQESATAMRATAITGEDTNPTVARPYGKRKLSAHIQTKSGWCPRFRRACSSFSGGDGKLDAQSRHARACTHAQRGLRVWTRAEDLLITNLVRVASTDLGLGHALG